MRSSRMRRSKVIEEAFAGELEALDRGLRRYRPGMYGTSAKLLQIARTYADELNKVRKYACPLSTNILLASIVEAVLLALILQDVERAAKTQGWKTAVQLASADSWRTSKEESHPTFSFAELIQIADQMGMLKTVGVQKKVDLLILDGLSSELRDYISLSSWDAKRNHNALHQIRDLRNAVHPLKLVNSEGPRVYEQFEETIWNGLRILLLLNVLLDITSPLNT